MLAAPYKADLSFLGGQDFQSGSLAHVIIGSLFSCYIHEVGVFSPIFDK